jgi:hypothetical protein
MINNNSIVNENINTNKNINTTEINILISKMDELKKIINVQNNNSIKIMNQNFKNLEETIPANSIQSINNQLVNIILEKDKKIEELCIMNNFYEENNFDMIKEKKKSNIKLSNIKIINNSDKNDIDDENNNLKPINLVLNKEIIQYRESDNYINATQLCKAGGKNFGQWYRLDSTRELISVFASEVGIHTSQLTDSKKGNSNNFEQGTWIHPDLAIQLAQWISPQFALQVSKWIRQLFSTGKVEVNLKLIKEQENMIKEFEKKNKILENMIVKKQKRTTYPESNVIYIITNEENIKKRIYIIGKAKDLKERMSTYNKSSEHEVIYYKNCKNYEDLCLVETNILHKLDKYREQANRDRFILPHGEKINLFIEQVKKAIDYFNQ